MDILKKVNWLISLSIIVLTTLSFSVNADIPDFSAMKDVKQKKQAFWDYMYPLVEQANKEILVKRDRISQIQDKLIAKQEITTADHDFLRAVSDKYSVKTDDASSQKNITKLLKHVDYVPPALALAQSANESAWGTSRFAKQANNFFGQWCFSKGCGLVPSRRDAGSNHEVRKFASTQVSVRSYIHNINTGRAYALLRNLRAESRKNNALLTGHDLAAGLSKYSARGEEYIKELRSMIRTNKLKAYDQQFGDTCC